MKKKRTAQSGLFRLRVLLALLLCAAAACATLSGALLGFFHSEAPVKLSRTSTVASSMSPWIFAAYYRHEIEAPAVATDGRFLYSAAGFYNDIGGPSADFFRYDPLTNSWTSLAPVPTPLFAARAVYAANTNSIYIFGGYNGTGALPFTQIYNIGNGTWSYGAWMPDGRTFSNLAYYPGNGKIYVIGGFDTNNVQQSQTWEYNPVANTWDTSRAPIPMPMGGSGTGIVENYIYLVGAWPAYTTHYRYDIEANSWSQMAPSPVYIYEPAAATVGTNIYIIGGGNPFLGSAFSKDGMLSPLSAPTAPADSYNSTYIYDTLTNTWTTGPNLNLLRSFAAGTAIGTELVVVGGFDQRGDTDTVERAFTQGGPTPCQYTITPGTGTIVPGTDDTGNHCNDCDTLVILPFPFELYNQTYNWVNVSSKGRLDFVCDNAPSLAAQCLPPPADVCHYDFTIFALWGSGITTLTDPSGCSTWANGCGIFTSISGIAPNRVFNIEWHTTLLRDPAQTQTFEVRLYENDPNKRFDVIYGTVSAPQSYGVWVDGVQGDLGAGQITRDFCPCCSGYPCTSCGWTPPQNESRTYILPPCPTPTPTPTPTASPTPTPTASPTPTPTPIQCDSGIIVNGGFETGTFPPWVIGGTNPSPMVTTTQHRSGTYSAFAGGNPQAGDYCGYPHPEPTGDSSFYQQFTVPAGGGTLSFWHWDCTTDGIPYDWQDAYITDISGTILQTIFHQCTDNHAWVQQTVNMAAYAGHTVRIKFLVHQDGFGDLTGMYVDDVTLLVPCGSPTPTATPTATATPRATPTPRSTPIPRTRPSPPPRP